MIVDDEEQFLAQMREILEECGYQIKTALNGQEALTLLKENPGFSVILTDERMPVMTGTEFAQKANILAPLAVKIMITAYPEKKILQDAINKGEIFRFLTKPIDIDEVLLSVNSALELYEKRIRDSQLTNLFEKAKNKVKQLNAVLESTLKEKEDIKKKTIPILSSQSKKISELNKEVNEKTEIIEEFVKGADAKDADGEDSRNAEVPYAIVFDPSKYERKSRELEQQKINALKIKDNLKKEYSGLLENWQSFNSNPGESNSEIAHQCKEKLLEVRQCLLSAQLQYEETLVANDSMIKELEDTFFHEFYSQAKESTHSSQSIKMKNLMEDLIRKRERSVNELSQFKSLDLSIGREFFEHDDLELEEGTKPRKEDTSLAPEESRGMEAFLIPYSDLMSILFAFFVLVYALSDLNEAKFLEFFSGLDNRNLKVPTANVSLTQEEVEMLTKVKELIKDNVDPDSIKRGDVVSVQLESQALFDPASADLISDANDILYQSLKPYIKKGVKQIVVEGHTDDVPIRSDKFPSNWELSSARASSVARFIINTFEFPGKWVKVVGLGHYRPVEPNTTDENRRKNRRVEIKILKPPN